MIVLAVLGSLATAASAQKDRSGGEDRWNGVGPAWYQTECGHIGFSVTHGLLPTCRAKR